MRYNIGITTAAGAQMSGYALVQSGYDIYGVGKTPDDAIADAEQWLEEASSAVRERGLHGAYRVHGALVTVPCSDRLMDYFRQHGTTTYAEDRDKNMICLPDELT